MNNFAGTSSETTSPPNVCSKLVQTSSSRFIAPNLFLKNFSTFT